MSRTKPLVEKKNKRRIAYLSPEPLLINRKKFGILLKLVTFYYPGLTEAQTTVDHGYPPAPNGAIPIDIKSTDIRDKTSSFL